MTQPLPNEGEQVAAMQSVFAQYEPELYAGYLDMITEYLAAVKLAMFAGGITKLALLPDPYTIFSQTPKWAALVTKYEKDIAYKALIKPYQDLGITKTLFDTRPYVQNWLHDRQNKMSHTPQEVFSAVKQLIHAGQNNGASVPDVTKQISELLDVTATDTWKNRAVTVARTELLSAYNGGAYDAFKMIAEGNPVDTYQKRWLATLDGRTRPDHVTADMQVVPFSLPFTVGGHHMMHPGDDTAPADQVINCRCTFLMELSGEATAMDNRQFLSAGLTLAQDTTECFCLETHKPGLCKGQKRGQQEARQAPAVDQDTNSQQAHTTAVSGLTDAIRRAQQILQATSDPKMRAKVTKALTDYHTALASHQGALNNMANEDKKRTAQADQDTKQQDTLDKNLSKAKERLADYYHKQHETAAQKAALAKMSPAQRRAYQAKKAAEAKAKREQGLHDAVSKAAQAATASAGGIMYGMRLADIDSDPVDVPPWVELRTIAASSAELLPGIGGIYPWQTPAQWTALVAAVVTDQWGVHDLCTLTACRMPLHPGPCKGWKHTLHAVSPGAYHTLEKARVEKANTRRIAKIEALKQAGKPIPKSLLTPITYDASKLQPPPTGAAHPAGTLAQHADHLAKSGMSTLNVKAPPAKDIGKSAELVGGEAHHASEKVSKDAGVATNHPPNPHPVGHATAGTNGTEHHGPTKSETDLKAATEETAAGIHAGEAGDHAKAAAHFKKAQELHPYGHGKAAAGKMHEQAIHAHEHQELKKAAEKIQVAKPKETKPEAHPGGLVGQDITNEAAKKQNEKAKLLTAHFKDYMAAKKAGNHKEAAEHLDKAIAAADHQPDAKASLEKMKAKYAEEHSTEPGKVTLGEAVKELPQKSPASPKAAAQEKLAEHQKITNEDFAKLTEEQRYAKLQEIKADAAKVAGTEEAQALLKERNRLSDVHNAETVKADKAAHAAKQPAEPPAPQSASGKEIKVGDKVTYGGGKNSYTVTSVGKGAVSAKSDTSGIKKTFHPYQVEKLNHAEAKEPAAPEASTKTTGQVAQDITDTYHKMLQAKHEKANAAGGKPANDYIMLSDLRKELPVKDKGAVDAALLHLAKTNQDVHLTPEANQKALTEEHKAGAVPLGNQNMHLIHMEGKGAEAAKELAKGKTASPSAAHTQALQTTSGHVAHYTEASAAGKHAEAAAHLDKAIESAPEPVKQALKDIKAKNQAKVNDSHYKQQDALAAIDKGEHGHYVPAIGDLSTEDFNGMNASDQAYVKSALKEAAQKAHPAIAKQAAELHEKFGGGKIPHSEGPKAAELSAAQKAAVEIAHKPGYVMAKDQLPVYQALSKAEFDGLPPATQSKIISDLVAGHGKLKHPDKIKGAEQTLAKFGHGTKASESGETPTAGALTDAHKGIVNNSYGTAYHASATNTLHYGAKTGTKAAALVKHKDYAKTQAAIAKQAKLAGDLHQAIAEAHAEGKVGNLKAGEAQSDFNAQHYYTQKLIDKVRTESGLNKATLAKSSDATVKANAAAHANQAALDIGVHPEKAKTFLKDRLPVYSAVAHQTAAEKKASKVEKEAAKKADVEAKQAAQLPPVEGAPSAAYAEQHGMHFTPAGPTTKGNSSQYPAAQAGKPGFVVHPDDYEKFSTSVQSAAQGSQVPQAVKWDIGALNEKTHGVPGISKEQMYDTVYRYTGSYYENINTKLHSKPVGWKPSLNSEDGVERSVAYLDEAMRQAPPFEKPIMVFRGFRRPQKKYGDAWNDSNVSGLEWTQKSPSSTSSQQATAEGFASGDSEGNGVVARLLVHPSVKGIYGTGGSHEGENEVILERGVRYRVIADYGKIGGIRRLDVEVVPA